MKKFATKYGEFGSDGRSYIIHTPRTPRPWINVISNGDYGLTVSQAGGGYSWLTHAQLNRITRWEQDLVRDDWGKFIYLREDVGRPSPRGLAGEADLRAPFATDALQSGKTATGRSTESARIWSAAWKPVCLEPEAYRCEHGIGYTLIESKNFGIESALLLFVPNDEPMELWHLTLRNTTRRDRQISVITYFEWGLGNSPDWHREFHKSFIETEFDPVAKALYARKRLWEVPTERGHWNTDWPYVAFHSASVRPASFDADKESFLGMYGSPHHPASVSSGTLARRAGNWLDPIGSLQVRVTLKPHEEKSVWFTLGAASSREQAARLAGKYRTGHDVKRALAAVRERWDGLLGTVTVSTPDPAMDLMENSWLKYQAVSGRLWGRTAYYQTGGAFGFRDQLQDSQIFLPIDPALTLNQILLHARHQFTDGSVYHWWHPMSEIGLQNKISDNLLWLPFVTKAFLDETADMTALDARATFVDSREEATLYDHCVRAIDRTLARFSPRGLPLIGAGDWNDGLSAVGLDMKGESVWLGAFLHRILVDFSEIAARRGEPPRGEQYGERARRLREALNNCAWDGEWYFGATKDSGEKLGSKENAEGTVWLNPQTWSVIGGVADAERSRLVMNVVERKLESEIGPLLLTPAYTHPDRDIGYLTRYAPGMRENGGVYTHGATWAVIAEAMVGRGEAAYRMFSKLNPVNRGMKPDRYCAEPYVTSGNIEGPESPFFGRGGWSWYTGSAAWLFKVGLEWVLGVRASFDGLVVDPCIPGRWKRFSVRRMFRGAVYKIEVRNPDRVMCGVKRASVDGKEVTPSPGSRGLTLPVFSDGTEHEVVVLLGK